MYSYGYGGGLIGLIVLILDLVAIVDVAKSSMGTLSKLLWILLILAFPVGGMVLYYLLGRKS